MSRTDVRDGWVLVPEDGTSYLLYPPWGTPYARLKDLPPELTGDALWAHPAVRTGQHALIRQRG